MHFIQLERDILPRLLKGLTLTATLILSVTMVRFNLLFIAPQWLIKCLTSQLRALIATTFSHNRAIFQVWATKKKNIFLTNIASSFYMYTHHPTLKLHCKNHFELFLHKTVSAALDIVKHSCKHITIGPLFCLLSKLLLTVVVLDCSCSRRL